MNLLVSLKPTLTLLLATTLAFVLSDGLVNKFENTNKILHSITSAYTDYVDKKKRGEKAMNIIDCYHDTDIPARKLELYLNSQDPFICPIQ